MITTKFGLSYFKKSLVRFKKGGVVTATHPAGTFTLDEYENAVFVAGGIGITPFRSMVKYATDLHLKTQIVLIYLDDDGEFVFQKEFDAWAKSNPYFKVFYIKSVPQNTGSQKKIYSLLTKYNRSIFYLSGPPAMVDFLQICANSDGCG